MIQRAKSYMDMLSNGIDPISGESVHNDSTLQQERLKKCFGYVSEILEELIRTNGIVSLPSTSESLGYTAVKNKRAFSLDMDQRRSIKIMNDPIIPMAFIKNVNAVIDTESTEKLTLKAVTDWLLKQGYISETKAPTLVNKSVKTVSPMSERVGIVEHVTVDPKTGEAKTQLLFSRKAQEYILDNIQNILAK